VAEIRRLQTLPDEFQLRGDRRDIQRQLGNAVPVELGKAVVRSLAESLGRLERPDQEPLADQLAML
jgi:DNA (cytosine-5)-methyltransferase 1